MTSSVRQLILAKGNRVHTISPEATVFEALERMAMYDIGALVVVEGERVVGIFSERDYARKVVLVGRVSRETKVREIMTDEVITVSPDTTVGECMAIMTGKRVRHLPVMEGERLAGLISIGDVVKAIMSEQEFMIAELESYITGSR
ncbi:CBS domain-containing protein [Calidithermus roseus]|uniref:Inosine-5'-monophosphate dehydrogenase n=1 Tax=Calidithermus roseus TaxID=1644118 RepID=A0A399EIZ3_9DEIN|nr:CBS domain-containing protein [Calidithermus roseus]RIH83049.1 Inosine-5'-monophosphate dehydrogenase [Calidithermus roseus]